jgi:hypothetical protein
VKNHFGGIPKSKMWREKHLDFFDSAFFEFLRVFEHLKNHISGTVKRFSKTTTVKNPKNTKDDAEIVNQKITLSSEFMKNIESLNHIIDCKS